MKKHSFNLKASMETIARQNGKLLDDLTKCVAYLREDGTYETHAIKSSRMHEVIKLHTGMHVEPTMMDEYSFFIFYPDLLGDHVLGPYKWNGDNSLRVASTLSKMEKLKYNINSEKGTVSGDFSNVPCTMGMGVANFADSDLTDAEIATIIIHELGHLFSYFQFATTVIATPLILALTAKQVLSEDDRSKRKMILDSASQTLGIEKSLVREDYIDNPKPGLDVLLLTDYLTMIPQGSLNGIYNIRVAEQIADTFAVRHCGAKTLASGLQKYYKAGGHVNRSLISHAFKEFGSLLKLIGQHKTSMLSILFSRFIPDKYDRKDDRFEFMKLMLIDDLKRIPSNDKELRNKILSEIAAVEEIMKDFVYRRDVITFFWDTVGKGRNAKKDADKQKALERMVYNDLFYKATQLKQLTDN